MVKSSHWHARSHSVGRRVCGETCGKARGETCGKACSSRGWRDGRGATAHAHLLYAGRVELVPARKLEHLLTDLELVEAQNALVVALERQRLVRLGHAMKLSDVLLAQPLEEHRAVAPGGEAKVADEKGHVCRRRDSNTAR
jgi:hypothetical protein